MRALDTWGPVLPAAAVAVLTRMALSTLDNDPRPKFWGSWEILAPAAGHTRPSCGDHCRGCKACAGPRKAVQRRLGELERARAIVRTRRASRARSAEFQLYIHGPAPVENPDPDPLPGLDP